jgi:hypothetical protein
MERQQGAILMNNPNTLNPAVLTETLSVRLPLDFIKTLIAEAKQGTSHCHITSETFWKNLPPRNRARRSRQKTGDVDHERAAG